MPTSYRIRVFNAYLVRSINIIITFFNIVTVEKKVRGATVNSIF